MSQAEKALRRFESAWKDVLSREVQVTIAWEKRTSTEPLLFQPGPSVANAFATSLGFQSIGFNWEMLDPEGGIDAPRSVLGTMIEALAKDLSNPAREWLGDAKARECAEDFLTAFDPIQMIAFTNHLNGLWWPISAARDEWTFVIMDEEITAMLLLAKQH